MTDPAASAHTANLIAEAAARDESVAKVIREICSLDGAVRGCALDLVGAHLRGRVARDVLDCIDALRDDDVARTIAGLL